MRRPTWSQIDCPLRPPCALDACAFDDPRHERVVRDAVTALVDATSSHEYAYNPDANGWVALLQPGDGDDVLGEFCSLGLPAMLWEGAVRDAESGCILTCICTNNSFGVTVIVPDVPGGATAPAAEPPAPPPSQ